MRHTVKTERKSQELIAKLDGVIVYKDKTEYTSKGKPKYTESAVGKRAKVKVNWNLSVSKSSTVSHSIITFCVCVSERFFSLLFFWLSVDLKSFVSLRQVNFSTNTMEWKKKGKWNRMLYFILREKKQIPRNSGPKMLAPFDYWLAIRFPSKVKQWVQVPLM